MAQQWPVPTRPFRTAGQRVRTHPEQRGRSRTLRHAHTTVPASRFTYPGRRLNNEPVALYTAATFHLPAGILSLRGRTPVSFWRYPSCQQSPAAHPHSLSAPPSRLMKPRGGLSARRSLYKPATAAVCLTTTTSNASVRRLNATLIDCPKTNGHKLCRSRRTGITQHLPRDRKLTTGMPRTATAHTESRWDAARPVAVHNTTLIQRSPLMVFLFGVPHARPAQVP